MAKKMNSYTEGRARKNINPSAQQTDCGLRAVKTYENAESCARRKEDSWEEMDGSTEGCNQGTSTSSRETQV